MRSGIVVDERFATSRPGVFAIGDVAEFYDPVFRRHRRIEHWSNAAYHGTTLGQDPRGRRGRPLRHRLGVLLRGVRPLVQALRRPGRPRRLAPRRGLRRGGRGLPLHPEREHDRRGRHGPGRRHGERVEGGDPSRRGDRRLGAKVAGTTTEEERWLSRTSSGSRSTRFARCRWTPCSRRTPAIPGTAMALAPLAYLALHEVMRHNPADPAWPNRDRFVLSAGHACILQYTALHLTGYDLPMEQLQRFRQWESMTPGPSRARPHAGRRDDHRPARPGLRERRRARRSRSGSSRETFNRPHHELVDHRVYVHLLRRRPDGGRLVRDGIARRHERARQARLLLRRQPHHDRRHDVDLVHRGSRRAVRGARLARAAGRRRQRPRCAARGDRRRGGGDGRGRR